MHAFNVLTFPESLTDKPLIYFEISVSKLSLLSSAVKSRLFLVQHFKMAKLFEIDTPRFKNIKYEA